MSLLVFACSTMFDSSLRSTTTAIFVWSNQLARVPCSWKRRKGGMCVCNFTRSTPGFTPPTYHLQSQLYFDVQLKKIYKYHIQPSVHFINGLYTVAGSMKIKCPVHKRPENEFWCLHTDSLKNTTAKHLVSEDQMSKISISLPVNIHATGILTYCQAELPIGCSLS